MKPEIKSAMAEYANKGTLISFHAVDQTLDKFFAGYVESVEDDKFLVRYVDPNGLPGEAGKMEAWFDFNEISWVEAGTAYLKGLAKLHEVFWDFKSIPETEWQQGIERITTALRYCLVTEQACYIRLGDEKLAAKAMAMSQQWVSLVLLDEDGKPIGDKLIRLSSILGIRVGGIEEATLTFLASQE